MPKNKIIGPNPLQLKQAWPPKAIIAGTPLEFKSLKGLLPSGQIKPPLLGGLVNIWQTETLTLVGPVLGAALSLMLLEIFKASGVEEFIFLGRAGAIKVGPEPWLNLNEIFLPTEFITDDHTPPYFKENLKIPELTAYFTENKASLESSAGLVWSTGAIFRETIEIVRDKADNGAKAVDMETAFLAAGADFLNLKWAPVLIISDELTDGPWKTTANTPEFKNSLYRASKAIIKALARTA